MPTISISADKTAQEKFSKRTPLGSTLRTRDWDNYSNFVKDKAFFSASVNNAKILSEMKEKIGEALSVAKTSPEKAYMSRDKFVRDIKDSLERKGYALGGDKLTDITSNKRLSLIYNMNREEALGYAKHKKDTCNGVALNMYPAYELFRAEDRKVPRNWLNRWRAAGGQVFNGRMIALKDDEVWSKISRFGKPYPPFDFNSGMDIEDVSKEECVKLGLLEEYEDLLPASEDDDYELSNDVSNVDKELLSKLESTCEKRGLYAIEKNGVLQLSPHQNAFVSWSDMNLPSAKTWKHSELGKIANDVPKDVEKVLAQGEIVKDVFNDDVLYSDKTIHWMYNENEIKDKISRIPKYSLSKASIKAPVEVWDQGNQINYLSTYTNSKGKVGGIVTIVTPDKSVSTYFPPDVRRLNLYRKGKRIYDK